MNKSSFFIIGQHAVIEALRNPKRKVLRVFLTEESKKNIHRKSPKKNLLEDVKVYFKTKKELDKYSTKENLLHQGYVAEIEHLEKPILKDFIKEKKDTTLVCLDGVTDPRNIGSLIRSAASFGKCLSLIMIPSILNEAALLINDPIFLGSVTPSKQTRVISFFSFIKSLRIGFSRCSTSAT